MLSGSLSQLIVGERALSTIDYGRIGYILESADTDAQLKTMMESSLSTLETVSSCASCEPIKMPKLMHCVC